MTASNRFERGAFLSGRTIFTGIEAAYRNPPGVFWGWILLIWYFQTHTEIGSQSLGIFTSTGSDTPALSLFFTASSYEVPTATILVSSSDNATQLSRGADFNASKRKSLIGFNTTHLDTPAYRRVSPPSTNFRLLRQHPSKQ